MRTEQARVKLHRAIANQQQLDSVMAIPTSINLGSPSTQHRVEDAKKISPVFPRRRPGNRCEQMPPQGIDDRAFIAHLFLMQAGGAHGGLVVVVVDDEDAAMGADAKPRAQRPIPALASDYSSALPDQATSLCFDRRRRTWRSAGRDETAIKGIRWCSYANPFERSTTRRFTLVKTATVARQ